MESRLESRQRNAHKRYSGMQDQNGQFVQRRTTSSKDRHGHIYPEDFPETTIRPVSPESPPQSPIIAEPDRYMSDPGTLPTRSATPLPNSRRGHNSRARAGTPQATPNGHTFTAGSSEAAISPTYFRPRTRTLEEPPRESSAVGLVAKTRQRLGSLQSSTIQDNNGSSSSIGFPSVIPQSLDSQFSNRRRVAKPQGRTLSPIRNPGSTSRHAALSSTASDRNKILQLMKTTCGRMHGILSFRTPSMTSWSSGYCAINVATGSLIYQTKGDVSLAKTLVSDLRGCNVRTLYDGDAQATYLDVSTHTDADRQVSIHLRPHVPETFDSWLAALLCWQPMKSKAVQTKPVKPPTPLVSHPRRRSPGYERRTSDRRRNSLNVLNRDASIIKVGKMLMWDKEARSGESSPLHIRKASIHRRPKQLVSTPWRKVSCMLLENGNIKLLADESDFLLSLIPLSQLSRCGIQRLDPSVLETEFSLAIYPQYQSTATSAGTINTTYLAMESRISFEVWFVLLRAFTIPDLFGPGQPLTNPHLGPLEGASSASRMSASEMFRVERQLLLRLLQAKFHSNHGKHSQGPSAPSRHQNTNRNDMISGNYYAEINLDGEIRGKTAVHSESSNPTWLEEFEFSDLPPVLSITRIDLKTRNPSQRDWTLISQTPIDIEHGDIDPLSIVGDIEISPLDSLYGKVDIRLDDIEKSKDIERWWTVINEDDDVVGELLMKIRYEELVVLMRQDYQPLLDLLLAFSNGLTRQIAQIAHSELKRLSEILLNIFQVSAQASDWIMSLAEDEIDNVHKETPVSKFRYGRRIASHDSYDSGVERSMVLRDLNKSATVEANLLFRGNSLCSKAMELHMRRLGKDYLEDTLTEPIRDIDEFDQDCEVNPNLIKNSDDMKQNWRNLMGLTEKVWKSIVDSASHCPPELRIIFRHIRACADDQFGDFLRTVTYSSVSGFLFLRFFCPAVLNPKLFGLLKGMLIFNDSRALVAVEYNTNSDIDDPRPRAKRSLVLITKGLQTLANLSTLGGKEPWMEPMNQFINAHRQEFKDFVDTICAISPDRATSAIPPSYATPITILGRLPSTIREGFPSLPYLIDQARESARLVNLWLEARNNIETCYPMSDELKSFDALCEKSHQKSRDRLNRTEHPGRANNSMWSNWNELKEQMERKARISSPIVNASTQRPTNVSSLGTKNSSTSSFGEVYHSQTSAPREAHSHAPVDQSQARAAHQDENSRTTDNDAQSSGNETDTPPVSASAVWDPSMMVHNDETMSTLAVKDDDEESVEVPETLVGSSMYSLGSNPSNKLAKPPRSTVNHHHRKRDKTPAKSSYYLNNPSSQERPSPGVGQGQSHRERATSSGNGKSVYRLKDLTTNTESGGRSPTSRDGAGGILRVGDFGSFFKRKVKEKEDGWRP